jgi:EAL domain-containing protein (putative c-di-GMP-specific phosphodiesterase class I)
MALDIPVIGFDPNSSVLDVPYSVNSSQFFLVWQPIHDVAHNACVGYEVLIRWDHPILGRIRPDIFIPIAETSGRIIDIDAWVLRKACQEAARCCSVSRFSVNVSSHSLMAPGFVDNVRWQMNRHFIVPGRLELEITERAAVAPGALQVLEELRAIGARIVIDDFGVGHSCLSALATLPIDKVKLDRSFLLHHQTNPRCVVVIRSVIDLAHTLGFTVCAEGVETGDTLGLLQDLKCDEAQGYLLGRPEKLPPSY